MADLFASETNEAAAAAATADRPLADRMRPATLAEFSGQDHLLASGKPLLHKLFLPMGALLVVVDTLLISYFIR